MTESDATDFEADFSLAHDCWFLTGPTASGKTDVGMELAKRLDAEIISLDSMAVYRGMDIGTAKPSPEQCATIEHHLIDILDPTEQFSVSNYVEQATKIAQEIRQRGREVLFVGGTPMYLKAMLRGIFDGPPADWDLRREIEAEIETVGLAALHERLMHIDPLSATKLHPNDKRRMIRALEVYRLTGQPISHLQVQFDEDQPAEACKVFALQWRREELHQRIERRVDKMFAIGFLEEVRGLIDTFGQLSRTASQAVGYREVIDHLRGTGDLEETIEKVKARTRQFARRQETWFRSLSECRSVSLEEEMSTNDVASQVIAAIGATWRAASRSRVIEILHKKQKKDPIAGSD